MLGTLEVQVLCPTRLQVRRGNIRFKYQHTEDSEFIHMYVCIYMCIYIYSQELLI